MPPSNSDLEQDSKPIGIAARIANLQLGHLAKSPGPVVTETKETPNYPIVSETRQDNNIYSKRNYRPSPAELARLLARSPPPPPRNLKVPPKRRVPLPTPPPEPEYVPEPEPELETELEYEPEIEETSEQESSIPIPNDCIKCRDFSHIDTYAANFPRDQVASLDHLAYDLCSPFPEDLDKARAIFYWLHLNVAYDAETFFSNQKRPQAAADVLQTGLAVCEGYGGLFKALADLAGLQCHKISGHGKGYGYQPIDPSAPTPPQEGGHAWNCVFMENEWHLIDPCWGSGHLDHSGAYTAAFDPMWFSSTPAEFGKRHFPQDPSYQLVSEEDGGVVSWEEYIKAPSGPKLYVNYYREGFHPWFLEPWSATVPRNSSVNVTVFKQCEHASSSEADNLVIFINLPGDNRIPLRPTTDGGWSAQIDIPAGPGDIFLYCVATMDNQDARGIGVDAFTKAIGRKAMSFQGLASWTIQ